MVSVKVKVKVNLHLQHQHQRFPLGHTALSCCPSPYSANLIQIVFPHILPVVVGRAEQLESATCTYRMTMDILKVFLTKSTN